MGVRRPGQRLFDSVYVAEGGRTSPAGCYGTSRDAKKWSMAGRVEGEQTHFLVLCCCVVSFW